jgi:hypothetical protein
LGSGAGVLAQNIGVFVKRLVISRLPSSLLEIRILFEHRIPRFQERSAEPQIPRLRSPGFPVEIGGVGELHAPFLKRKAHTRPLSSAAWQEIRVGMTKERETVHKE